MSLQIGWHIPITVSTVGRSLLLPFFFFFLLIPHSMNVSSRKRGALQKLPFLFTTADLLSTFCPGDTLTHTSYSPHPTVSLIVILWVEEHLGLLEKAAEPFIKQLRILWDVGKRQLIFHVLNIQQMDGSPKTQSYPKKSMLCKGKQWY